MKLKTLLTTTLTSLMLVTSVISGMGQIIISQYYEGTSNNKWIELTNVGTDVDLTANPVYLLMVGSSSAQNMTTKAPTLITSFNSGTWNTGVSKLIKNASAVLPSYAVADVSSNNVSFNGAYDVVFLSTSNSTTAPAAWNARTDMMCEVVSDLTTATSYADISYVRNQPIVAGNTTFTLAEWTTATLADVESAVTGTTQRLGFHLYGPDIAAPAATFAPGNGATGVATAAAPTITFDEAIHNISDGSLVTNPTSLITFTKNDAMDKAVPFTATIDGASKVITITPDASLTPGQLYYLAVASVQDAAGNDTVAQSITFTTAATLSTETEITGFTLAGVEGTMDATNHAIGVVLPYGTDVTAIEPTIELSLGATVDLSGVQDFTNPVTYTVTAEDGVTTMTWLVTVTFSAPEFTTTYPKSANVGKNQFDVVVNLKSAAKVYYMMQASVTPEPASADIKTANNVIDVTTPATDYPVTFNGLDASTTYDVYFVTEDNGGTILMATPVKLSVTTSAGVLTIYDIQYTADPSGDSPYKDQVVTFSGIVTAIKLSATTGAPIGFYIQDGAGKWNGMNVYSTATDYSFPTTLALGDNVTVNGTVTEYRGSAGTNLTGLTEVKEVTSVDIVSTGNALPAASIITAAEAQDEGYESVLITVKNANFVSDNAGGTCVVNDGTADLTLFKSLFPTLAISAAHKYDVTGIITDYSNASTSMYELYPRDANDVVDVTTGINDNKTVATKVYPNPFTSNFTVNSGKVVSTISVYNLLGQKIVEHNYSAAEVNVPVADLKSGVYIVNVRFQDGTTTNLRMVKK